MHTEIRSEERLCTIPAAMESSTPIKKIILFFIALFLFFVVKDGFTIGAVPQGQDPAAVQTGLAILIFASVLWFSEAIPLAVTALLVPLLAALCGVSNVKDSFSSFAHPLIFLLFGGFALAAALAHHGLDRWIAHGALRLGKRRFYPTAISLFFITAVLSMWISNTATTALMIPVALGLITSMKQIHDESFVARITPFLLLGVAYSASIGGIGMLIGTAPNALAAAHLNLSFSDWAKVGLPSVVILFPLLCVLLIVIFRIGKVPMMPTQEKRQSITPAALATLGIFILTLTGWFYSDSLAEWFGIKGSFNSLVAMTAVITLIVLRLVHWKDIEQSVDWGVVILFGGGIALSKVLSTTGTSLYLANGIRTLTDGWPLLAFIFVLILFILFLTEISSNTATTAIMIPIFAAVAPHLGITEAKLVLPIAIASSCAFMLPIATPPNAIAYATGKISQQQMVRIGLVLNLVFATVLTLLSTLL